MGTKDDSFNYRGPYKLGDHSETTATGVLLGSFDSTAGLAWTASTARLPGPRPCASRTWRLARTAEWCRRTSPGLRFRASAVVELGLLRFDLPKRELDRLLLGGVGG